MAKRRTSNVIEAHPLFKEASMSSLRAYYEGWLVASTFHVLEQASSEQELATILAEERSRKVRRARRS